MKKTQNAKSDWFAVSRRLQTWLHRDLPQICSRLMGLLLMCVVPFVSATAIRPAAASSVAMRNGSVVQLGESGNSAEVRSAPATLSADSTDSGDSNRAGGIYTVNTNWSGYVVNATVSAVSLVEGRWVIPSLTCGDEDSISYIFVGIDGASSDTVEQIGTDQDCRGKVGNYSAWYEMYPAGLIRFPLPVHPGDEMCGSVKYIGHDQFILALANLTTGSSFSTIQFGAGAGRSSAEWIVEVPGMKHLANFGTVRLKESRATIDGTTGPISSFANYDSINMIDQAGPIKTQTFGLSAGGANFAVVWYHR